MDSDLLNHIPYPKTMIWNSSRLALSRPLRWLCVLWGMKSLRWKLVGSRAANIASGTGF